MNNQDNLLTKCKELALQLDTDHLETLMYELEAIYLDGQDPAVVLTPDAPEMTVGDSSPINNSDLDNSGGGWWCKCGWPNHADEQSCTRTSCGKPRPKTTDKSDERTPSPTPSFR